MTRTEFPEEFLMRGGRRRVKLFSEFNGYFLFFLIKLEEFLKMQFQPLAPRPFLRSSFLVYAGKQARSEADANRNLTHLHFLPESHGLPTNF
jgi:hypothetical protein